MKKEFLSTSMTKLIMAVSLIVLIGALFRTVEYFLAMPKDEIVINNEIEKEEIEKDETADWQVYSRSDVAFEFRYPKNWEITADYFYETPAGIKANIPTILFREIGNNDSNDSISINERQFSCEENIGKCVDLSIFNVYIGTHSQNQEILNVFDKIIGSFKKVEKINIDDWQTYRNEEYGFEVKYPKEWRIREEYNTDKLFSVDFIFNINNRDEKVFLIKLFKDKSIEEIIKNDRNWTGTVNVESVLLLNRETTKITQRRPCGPGDKDYKSLNTIYTLNYNGNPYSIWLIPGTCNRDWTKHTDDTLDQILSFFKFIEKEETADWKTYRNEEYGFEISLLESWKGYKVFEESWKGNTLDSYSVEYEGPKIVIRNPKWSEFEIWQDVPILVFTKFEWQLIEDKNLNIFAASIAPSKLEENNKYVFSLPPRWVGFTDALGQDEAQGIVDTFKVIDLD